MSLANKTDIFDLKTRIPILIFFSVSMRGYTYSFTIKQHEVNVL